MTAAKGSEASSTSLSSSSLISSTSSRAGMSGEHCVETAEKLCSESFIGRTGSVIGDVNGEAVLKARKWLRCSSKASCAAAYSNCR
eukprot:Skav216540  [mRNA]  locus=scaffold1776:111277:115203:- [translate_table: standard]